MRAAVQAAPDTIQHSCNFLPQSHSSTVVPENLRAGVDRPHIGIHQPEAIHHLMQGSDPELRELVDYDVAAAVSVECDHPLSGPAFSALSSPG
jgi:hypothetical protein